MTLEELIEARIEGTPSEIPSELRAEFECAEKALQAIHYALGETIVLGEEDCVDRPPPTLPEDYEITRELGRGGMGVVYLARQRSLDRLVAVKVLRPGDRAFGPLVRRFLDEARHLARLRHPNIVSVHEVGRAGDEPFFTMDFIEGESLASLVSRGPLSPSRAVAILTQATEAIQFAHSEGIIHRDLKPANILLDPSGRVHVSDFGLARDLTRTSDLTHSGELLGTPAYMAPEQASGEASMIGEATDVHALGVVLYEMLTGRLPYGCDAPVKVLTRLLQEEPLPPRRVDRRIPRDLETIVLCAMAKSPQVRYPTAGALLDELRRFASGEPIRARRASLIGRAARFGRRRVREIALLFVAGLAIAIGVRSSLQSRAPVPKVVQVEREDRTSQETLELARAQLERGNAETAITLLVPLLGRVPAEETAPILDFLDRAARECADLGSAGQAALAVVESRPEVSFGPLDLFLARDAIRRIEGAYPFWDPGSWSSESMDPSEEVRRLLELGRGRVRIALENRDLRVEERKELEPVSMRIDLILSGEWRTQRESPPTYPDSFTLPVGEAEELLQEARDLEEDYPDFRRKMLCAIVAARALTASGESNEARKAYQLAYDLVRSYYPFYAGDFEDVGDRAFLLESHAALERLGAAPGPLAGGIELRITGAPLPDQIAVHPVLELWGAHLEDSPHIVGSVPSLRYEGAIEQSRSPWLGVVDGTYRVAHRGTQKRWSVSPRPPPEAFRTIELLRFDLPTDPIQVAGETVPLEIRRHVMEEVQWISPGPDDPIDFEEDVLRWRPVPGTDQYRIRLSLLKESADRRTRVEFGEDLATSTRCALADFELKAGWAREGVRSGCRIEVSIEALDKDGLIIGKTAGGRPFLVVRPPGTSDE